MSGGSIASIDVTKRTDKAHAGHGLAAEVELWPLAPRSIRHLREEWGDLADNAAEPNPYLRVDFVEAALGLFPQGGAPRILSVRSAGQLIGLTILGIAERLARLPLSHAMSFDHPFQLLSTPLVRKGSEATFAKGIFDWFDAEDHALNFIRFHRFYSDGAVGTALIEQADRKGRFWTVIQSSRRAFVGTEAKQAGARHGFGRRAMKRLDAKKERLAKQGQLSFEVLQPRQSAVEWIEDFLDLEDKGAWGALATSARQSLEATQFLRTQLIAHHAEGRLRFVRLKLGERTIATIADLIDGQGVFSFKTAYDPAFRQYSPGVLLDLWAYEEFQANKEWAFMDSGMSGPHSVLDRMWPGGRELVDIAFARRGILQDISLRLAAVLICGREVFRLAMRRGD